MMYCSLFVSILCTLEPIKVCLYANLFVEVFMCTVHQPMMEGHIEEGRMSALSFFFLSA